MSYLRYLVPLLVIFMPGLTWGKWHNTSDPQVVLVKGPVGRDPDGRALVRREIRDIKANYTETWNLYLLGVQAIQQVDQHDPVSFFQIAGIHGLPHKDWQGVQGIPHKNGSYCPHQNTLFFGWHRIWLSLYEQELYKHVQAIASRYPSGDLRDRYVAAAKDFRIPYWDWALGPEGGSVPEYFVNPTIEVFGTDGLNHTIDNPLHHFEFRNGIAAELDPYWAQFTRTLRWPTTITPDAVTQDEKFVEDFEARRRSYQEKVNYGFLLAKNMNDLSKTYIEDVHGWIHYAVAGGIGTQPPGHMWPSDVSAFEPVFALHHCNVDRLFSLWQATQPDKFLVPEMAGTGNTFINAFMTIDADTNLLPFRDTAETFWTTDKARDTKHLGYVYPETMDWKYDSKDQYGAAVNATIAKLYSSSVRSVFQNGNLAEEDSDYLDWFIYVNGSRQALPHAFVLQFYMDDKSIGGWTGLMPRPEPARAHDAIGWMEGYVPITGSLADRELGHLASLGNSLKADKVTSYVADKVYWELFGLNDDGIMAPVRIDNGLTVELRSQRLHVPEDDGILMKYYGTPKKYLSAKGAPGSFDPDTEGSSTDTSGDEAY